MYLYRAGATRLASAASQNRLKNYVDRDYGVAFELPLAVVTKLTDYIDLDDIIRPRHRSTPKLRYKYDCWVPLTRILRHDTRPLMRMYTGLLLTDVMELSLAATC